MPVGLTRGELLRVFELCDPQGTGFVTLSRLLRLAEKHCEGQDVSELVRQLDVDRRGVLDFRRFCVGVRRLARQQDDAGGEGMMAPARREASAPSFVLTGAATPSTPSVEHGMAHGDMDADSAIGGSSSPENAKSQCSSMSDGESYECYGDVVDGDMTDMAHPAVAASNGPPSLPLGRNTWLRTSLRRTPNSNQETSPNKRWGSFRHSSGKRIGSNALASQLYRSSSFNSSGRSSNCDTAEDMFSDVSLEEDVLDLNHKVQMLQQQMTVLADGHTGIDDRYTRAKQDSAVLQERVHALEEQLRETEARAEERLADEQRRHRENVQRCDRDKTAQIEACAVRLQAAETETATLREECTRLRIAQDRLRVEKNAAQERLEEAQAAARAGQEDRETDRRARDEAARDAVAARRMVETLSKEVERLRATNTTDIGRLATDEPSELAARLADMQNELTELLHRNKALEESNEELQAQLISKSVQEGRHLLSGTSLAAELQAMTSEELRDSASEQASAEQVRSALKEQQEVNAQLRAYIDGILLNIVENYPQLLEVKLK